MRSRDQNNRAPRPFKLGGNEHGWSGGRKNNANLPSLKSLIGAKKAKAALDALQPDTKKTDADPATDTPKES